MLDPVVFMQTQTSSPALRHGRTRPNTAKTPGMETRVSKRRLVHTETGRRSGRATGLAVSKQTLTHGRCWESLPRWLKLQLQDAGGDVVQVHDNPVAKKQEVREFPRPRKQLALCNMQIFGSLSPQAGGSECYRKSDLVAVRMSAARPGLVQVFSQQAWAQHTAPTHTHTLLLLLTNSNSFVSVLEIMAFKCRCTDEDGRIIASSPPLLTLNIAACGSPSS